MTPDRIRTELDAVVATRKMLDHPFYRDWVDGKLTRDDLCRYAGQYHHFVHAFPTFVSAVHSRCERLDVRQMLLENLIEEERGADNHPELWLRFAEGIGARRDEVTASAPSAQTAALVERFRAQCSDARPAVGLATLYAYESQVPQVAQTKMDGLARHFGLTAPEAIEFFAVHREADVWHSAQEVDAIAAHIDGDADVAAVVAAADGAAAALWGFLDGVQEHRAARV